jgi:hypothetical protein
MVLEVGTYKSMLPASVWLMVRTVLFHALAKKWRGGRHV